ALLAAKTGYQLLELLDRAAAPHPRVDRIAACAQHQIVLGLKIEGAIEIERREILIELRPKAGPVDEHEIDFSTPGQKRAPNGSRGDALWAFMLHPFELRHHLTWQNGYAKDHLVL